MTEEERLEYALGVANKKLKKIALVCIAWGFLLGGGWGVVKIT